MPTSTLRQMLHSCLLTRLSALLRQRIQIVSDYLRIIDQLKRLCGISSPPSTHNSSASQSAFVTPGEFCCSEYSIFHCRAAQKRLGESNRYCIVVVCGVTSVDPNDKLGSSEVEVNIMYPTAFLAYTILSKILQTASAPAAQVDVVDPLSPISTHTRDFQTIRFGSTTVPVPPNSASLDTVVDLSRIGMCSSSNRSGGRRNS